MTDIAPFTAPSFSDKPICSRVDGTATIWHLRRGYAARSSVFAIYTADGRCISSRTLAAAFRKFAAL